MFSATWSASHPSLNTNSTRTTPFPNPTALNHFPPLLHLPNSRPPLPDSPAQQYHPGGEPVGQRVRSPPTEPRPHGSNGGKKGFKGKGKSNGKGKGIYGVDGSQSDYGWDTWSQYGYEAGSDQGSHYNFPCATNALETTTPKENQAVGKRNRPTPAHGVESPSRVPDSIITKVRKLTHTISSKNGRDVAVTNSELANWPFQSWT